MDKTIKDILTDLNSDIKLKNEENLLEIERKIFSLDINIDSNETLIFKTQWTIEENRRMILNNYHAAFSVNSKLANENTRDIFENRNVILSKYKVITEVEANFLEYQRRKSKLEYLDHKIDINKKLQNSDKKFEKVALKALEMKNDQD